MSGLSSIISFTTLTSLIAPFLINLGFDLSSIIFMYSAKNLFLTVAELQHAVSSI